MLNDKFSNINKSSWVKIFFYIVISIILLIITKTIIDRQMPFIVNSYFEKGYLDVSQDNNSVKNDLLYMQGEWECYPNQLLYSEDFKNENLPEKNYITYPHYWSDDKENFPDGKGYCTYRAVFKIPADLGGVGVYSRFQYSAYNIYVNGYLLNEVGNISENENEHYVNYNSSAGFLNPVTSDIIEIIVHIESYSHVSAGFLNPILFGTNTTVQFFRYFLMSVNGFAVGFLVLLICYFLMLFIQNRDKIIHLNFAVVCVAGLAITLLSCGETFAYFAVPIIDGGLLFKMEYMAIPIATCFATIGILKRYVKYKHIDRIVIVIAVVIESLILFLPNYEVSRLRFVFHVAPIILFFATTLVCLRKIFYFSKNKEKEQKRTALFEFIGLVVLLLGIIYSKLGFYLWESIDLFPLTTSLYCFIQIFALTSYYKGVEEYLIKMTKNLEKRVEERTAELIELNEKAQAATRAKSDFLARMSHEIRTPMNAIIGMSDLISSNNLDDIQLAYFRDIKSTSHSLLHIINDILDFSKIESGKFDVIPTHFNLYAFIDNICSIFYFSAKLKDLQFESEISDDIPTVIYSDEIRMKQVISNIISNAIKYTNEGYVKLKIGVTENHSGEKQIYFNVSDSGIGILKEDIPRLFNSFEQADKIKNRSIIGTGLGLAIGKQLVTLLNGRIEVESEYGVGSTFKVFFPLVEGDESKVEVTYVSEKVFGKDIKLLVVDDNSINLTVAMGILATHNINPDTATSGFQAIKMVLEQDYDLIFMDHMMPIMDGVEATKEIRNLGDKYKKIPIIALTANAISGTREFLIESGMDDFLSKPIDRTMLNFILAKWLPTEKIELHEEDEEVYEENEISKTNDSGNHNEILIKLFSVPGIEVQAAFNRLGGNVQTYIMILSQFVDEIPDYISKLNTFLADNNMESYAVEIHGIKGVLNNIGAEELGKKAFYLETASKNLETDTCRRCNPILIDEVLQLCSTLKEILPIKNASDIMKEESSIEKLQEMLTDLKVSCDIGDCSEIDKICEDLKYLDFGEDINKETDEAIRMAESMDYEKVSAICENVLTGLINKN